MPVKEHPRAYVVKELCFQNWDEMSSRGRRLLSKKGGAFVKILNKRPQA